MEGATAASPGQLTDLAAYCVLPGAPRDVRDVQSYTFDGGFVYQYPATGPPLTEVERQELITAAQSGSCSSRAARIVHSSYIDAGGVHKGICDRATEISKRAVRKWFPWLTPSDDVIFRPFQLRTSSSGAHPTNIRTPFRRCSPLTYAWCVLKGNGTRSTTCTARCTRHAQSPIVTLMRR
jgi:hypothetical protein